MRPFYERPDDRIAERRAIQKIASLIGQEAVETAAGANWDFVMTKDGVPRSIVEVKCRRNNSTQYPTLIISKNKVDLCLQYARSNSLAFVLLVQWADRLGWVQPTPQQYVVTRGGRYDRNDERDVELLYNIPVSAFTFLPGG